MAASNTAASSSRPSRFLRRRYTRGLPKAPLLRSINASAPLPWRRGPHAARRDCRRGSAGGGDILPHRHEDPGRDRRIHPRSQGGARHPAARPGRHHRRDPHGHARRLGSAQHLGPSQTHRQRTAGGPGGPSAGPGGRPRRGVPGLMASQEPSRRLWLSREVHRELLRLSLPTIVSTLAVPLLGLVDTIVLGRLPQVEPLGAAAAANTIFTSLFWVFGFLRMGTTALVAQASGRRDEDEAARTLFQALAIGAVVAVLLVVLQGPIGWVGFALIGAEPEVDRLARQYFAIRIFEAPAFMLSLGITGYLRGRGDAITPMLLVVLINTLNIVGDLLLVPGTWGLPSYGVRGAAWASLVAHTVGCGAGAVVVWRRVRTRWRWQWLAQWRQ